MENDDSFLKKYMAIECKHRISDVVVSFKRLRLNERQNNFLCNNLPLSAQYKSKYRFLYFWFKNVYLVRLYKMRKKPDNRYS